MSIWSRFIGTRKSEETNNVIGNQIHMCHMMPSRYAIVDVEIGLKDHKIHDIGALRHDGAIYHKTSKEELFEFLNDVNYVCGHNIITMPDICSQMKHVAGFWSIHFISHLYCFRNVLTTSL